MADAGRRRAKISRTVIVLGMVSLLTDMSSESIYPLVPLFLKNVLHAPVIAIGVIEGVAEFTASGLRILSGWMSDRFADRKWITVVGYALSSVSKPFLAITGSWPQVFAIRFADRLGKGIRSAPRDALIADVTPPESRGVSFGVHRTMDTVGAVLGPLVAAWLLWSMHLGYRRIFVLSAIPGILGVLMLIFFVKQRRSAHRGESRPLFRLSGFDAPFRRFLLVAVVFSIGNSSDAFLILRAQNVGITSLPVILMIYVLFNSVEASFAAAAGAFSDRVGRRNIILAGYLVFAAVYAGFGLAHSPSTIWVLFAAYGIYNALTQGVQRAFAADLIRPDMRGTGMGAYHMLTGLSLLPASVIAGYLWDSTGPSMPFFFGTTMAVIAALLLVMLFRGTVICTDR